MSVCVCGEIASDLCHLCFECVCMCTFRHGRVSIEIKCIIDGLSHWWNWMEHRCMRIHVFIIIIGKSFQHIFPREGNTDGFMCIARSLDRCSIPINQCISSLDLLFRSLLYQSMPLCKTSVSVFLREYYNLKLVYACVCTAQCACIHFESTEIAAMPMNELHSENTMRGERKYVDLQTICEMFEF